MPQAAIDQAFRRLAFNVYAVNQDDHVKNLSFQLPRGGSWQLAPAYDLTFARGSGFTARHQMRLSDKTSDIRHADLVAIAKTFGIKRAERVLDELRAAVDRFAEFAAERDVPTRARNDVTAAIRERTRSLGKR